MLKTDTGYKIITGQLRQPEIEKTTQLETCNKWQFRNRGQLMHCQQEVLSENCVHVKKIKLQNLAEHRTDYKQPMIKTMKYEHRAANLHNTVTNQVIMLTRQTCNEKECNYNKFKIISVFKYYCKLVM